MLVQALADGAQQVVAGLLPEGIVDVFEAIEVEPHQGELALARLRPGERSPEHHREHRAVGQLGHRIEERELLDEAGGLLLVGLVDDDRHAGPHGARAVANGHHQHAPPALTGRELHIDGALDLEGLAGQHALHVGELRRREVMSQGAPQQRGARPSGKLGGRGADVAHDEVAVVDRDVQRRRRKDGLEGKQAVVGRSAGGLRRRRRSRHVLSLCARIVRRDAHQAAHSLYRPRGSRSAASEGKSRCQ